MFILFRNFSHNSRSYLLLRWSSMNFVFWTFVLIKVYYNNIFWHINYLLFIILYIFEVCQVYTLTLLYIILILYCVFVYYVLIKLFIINTWVIMLYVIYLFIRIFIVDMLYWLNNVFHCLKTFISNFFILTIIMTNQLIMDI